MNFKNFYIFLCQTRLFIIFMLFSYGNEVYKVNSRHLHFKRTRPWRFLIQNAVIIDLVILAVFVSYIAIREPMNDSLCNKLHGGLIKRSLQKSYIHENSVAPSACFANVSKYSNNKVVLNLAKLS